MPNYFDMRLIKSEDGLLAFGMAPPVNISGWSVEFRMQRRFGTGGSGIIVGSAASGFNNVSGINVTGGAAGTLTVPINGIATSGLQPGNWAFTIARTDSGQASVLGQGWLELGPR